MTEVKWGPDDLDRCEHGRHSIDSCFDCPDGKSTGNTYLLHVIDGKREARKDGELVEVRIGTMVHGEPIWVVIRDKPRGQTIECSVCTEQVVPGQHWTAECDENQRRKRGNTGG